MNKIVYRTAASLNGYIADDAGSLAWLFAVGRAGGDDGHEAFLTNVGAIVEGSNTYEWVLHETDVLARPGQWQTLYGTRPTFVFTSRSLTAPEGADVRFCRGVVTAHLQQIRAAAGGKNIWVVGGGDLAGQFLDADALDELTLTVAPVALAGGAPLLPRRIESDRLTLTSVTQRGQFAELVYRCGRSAATA
ncbi:MAG: dihydrofolate reductase family protein [Janthinobacterium lividum]